MPELDDDTLKELGQLAVKLANNPKTRRQFVKAVREVEPDRRFPDVDMEDLREEMTQKLEDQRREAQTAVITARLEQQRAGLLGRFTEEQIADMETSVMQKYGLSDYEAAAKIYGADLQPVTPPSAAARHGQRWDMPDDKGLIEDPARWANNTAYAVLDELRAGKR